ncbi:MAG: DegV family protein [Anaerolineae bacterium]|nr:DegV family protein [Anaerolineae bacterium]
MSGILLMTDSTCDLPVEMVRRFDIRIVPTYVQFGQESLADDGVQLTRTDFYRRIVNAPIHPTTSAPPLGQTYTIMQQALNDADHVIALTAPAKLSGIYNIFRLVAEQTDPKRVTLLDSGMLSMGMGWLVIIAAEMAESGATPAEIVAAITALQPRADVWAALDTMLYLRRSGRVGWAASVVGNFLNIKPVIRQHDSVVTSITRVRTSQRMFNALVDLAHQNAPLDRLAVMHTANIENAQRLLAALADIHPNHEPVIVEVTPVIGVHVGPQGLGLGVIRAAS